MKKIRRSGKRPLERSVAECQALKTAIKAVTDIGSSDLTFSELRSAVTVPRPWTLSELTDGVLMYFCKELGLEVE